MCSLSSYHFYSLCNAFIVWSSAAPISSLEVASPIVQDNTIAQVGVLAFTPCRFPGELHAYLFPHQPTHTHMFMRSAYIMTIELERVRYLKLLSSHYWRLNAAIIINSPLFPFTLPRSKDEVSLWGYSAMYHLRQYNRMAEWMVCTHHAIY